jgi:UDP-N-acetylglucosamine 2-epimerase (non-hydrolysing)
MTVFGTRPEAIKLAPVIAALQARPEFRSVVTVTAQHREMLDQVLELFAIRPDHDLDIQRERQSLTGITVRALEGLDTVLAAGGIDLVLVQGDTTTTFAAALAAFYHGVPVAHVEAGLRTGNPASPFPEEINRRLTTQLSSLHLAPTRRNVANLRAEGVPGESIVCTGNTVIDALRHVVGLRVEFTDPRLAALDRDPRRVVLVTVHRRESWGPALDGIGRGLARLAADPGVIVVVPIHRNPVVRQSILPVLEGRENVLIVEPLAYGVFARLLDRADLVLTDSGGIQEEAPSLGKPVLVLRDTTERPEAVEAGTVALVGTDEDDLVDAAQRLLADPVAYARMARAVNPYGDGRAAERSVAALAWYLGLGPRPDEFDVDRPSTLAPSP